MLVFSKVGGRPGLTLDFLLHVLSMLFSWSATRQSPPPQFHPHPKSSRPLHSSWSLGLGYLPQPFSLWKQTIIFHHRESRWETEWLILVNSISVQSTSFLESPTCTNSVNIYQMPALCQVLGKRRWSIQPLPSRRSWSRAGIGRFFFFFCKYPNSKYFRLPVPYGFCYNYWTAIVVWTQI